MRKKNYKKLTNRKDIFQFPSEHPEIHQECNTFTIRIENVNKTKQTNTKKEGKKENDKQKKLRTSDSLTVDSKWPMGQINT